MSQVTGELVMNIASVCHEANRAWFKAHGDTSQVPWDEAPEWQQKSVCEGVWLALGGAGPRELHTAWCRHKVAAGWRFGPVKDAGSQHHPGLVGYDDLPDERRKKDTLFVAIVGALR